MSQTDRPPASRGSRQPAPADGGRHHRASGPDGAPRAGRRDVQRRRHDQPTTLQRLRTPILAIVVVALVAGVGLFVFSSATAPAYACTTIDTIQPPAEGELGQIQPDMGSSHVGRGDKVTYPVCPPASGKHENRQGFGPLEPQVYGPEDQSLPAGWVHNLEHGGLVLLYSCEKGACDDASLAELRQFSAGFPPSPVCGLSAGLVGPVIARFEQMPTRYAALLWNRALYLDTLDTPQVYDFYTRYSERVTDDGVWLAPPEEQCVPPSPSPPAEPGPSAG